MNEMKERDLVSSVGSEGEECVESVHKHREEKEHEWVERTSHGWNKE